MPVCIDYGNFRFMCIGLFSGRIQNANGFRRAIRLQLFFGLWCMFYKGCYNIWQGPCCAKGKHRLLLCQAFSFFCFKTFGILCIISGIRNFRDIGLFHTIQRVDIGVCLYFYQQLLFIWQKELMLRSRFYTEGHAGFVFTVFDCQIFFLHALI